jgi:hypothetical protein
LIEVVFSGESEIILIDPGLAVDAIRITGLASDTVLTFTTSELDPILITFTSVFAGEFVILIIDITELLD